MPLFRDFSDDQTTVLVWKYDDTDALDEKLLEPENKERILDYHPVKIKEVLMVRGLLKMILPEHKILYNDREPYLSPPGLEISITHSFPYAALAVSKDKTGIDVEPFNPKIKRIRHKFIQPEEDAFFPEEQQTEYLTVIWSVKESLYKLHHSNYWSLKKHYEVKPFTLGQSERLKCRVHDETVSDLFEARVEFFDNYCLTIVH